MKTTSNDWRPTASLEALKHRAFVLSQVRQFFDKEGYWEVQTPCLGSEIVVDAHLDPLIVPLRNGTPFYLQTSPEASMKRIMATGADAIYQLGPVFRADEHGDLHNPEFTMLEWYRLDDTMEDAIAFVERLLKTLKPTTTLDTVTYRDVFARHLRIDPIDCDEDQLAELVQKHSEGYQHNGDENRDDLLDVLMAFAIQPNLRGTQMVTNYPLSQGALARQSPVDPATAERFELFIDGIEIANGYTELLDADELATRMESENSRRVKRGATPLNGPKNLIEAMKAGLPACSGVALGFDRLLMVLSNAKRIDEVIAFPFGRV